VTYDIGYTPFDRDIWEGELEEFVPRKMYDMHAHLWSEQYAGANQQTGMILRTQIRFQDLQRVSRVVFPQREVHYLVLGTPLKDIDVQGHNSWLADQVAQDPLSVAGMVVSQGTSPEYVREQVKTRRFFVLKPYRFQARDKTNAYIRDFLPEPLIEAADDLHCGITLHLSRKTGSADPENLKDLKHFTSKYPHVQWILAHCARAFNCFMLERSVHVLKDLPNIWYDTSAVSDLYSHVLLLKYEDRKRIMFGSDNVPAGCMHGKYITYGRAWEAYKGSESLEHCDSTPTLVVYEQLRAQRRAAELLGLSQSEIEDMFFHNARRLIARTGC